MASDQEACEVGREAPETDRESVISFIIKVWLEDASAVLGRPSWRARITHVPSGAQRYLTRMDEIAAFIVPYLEAKGVRLEWWRRIRRRLRPRRSQDTE
jgi:hypothetical protein